VALAANALATVAQVKNHLGMSDGDLRVNSFTIYNGSSDATAATAEVTATNLVLVVTGGVNAGTSTVPLAGETITSLRTAVSALAKGWVTKPEGSGTAVATDLVIQVATACFETTQALTLMMVDNELIERLINGCSDLLERIAARSFQSTSYTNERYDGHGRQWLLLDNYPVTSIDRVCVGTVGVMTVKNEDSGAARVFVSVTTAAVVLKIVGGANAGTDTLTFAGNTTLTLMAAAINALSANGWSADLASAYGAFPSTDLLPTGASHVLNLSKNLEIPYTGKADFNWKENGMLFLVGGFSRGVQNVIVDYTAGFATIPDALIQIALEVIRYVFDDLEADIGKKSEKIGQYQYSRETFQNALPPTLRSQFGLFIRHALR